MARVASCPQCNHELLVPGEADSESWAKCPECRAFFQVKQATSREVPTALLVEADEQQTVELDSRGDAPDDFEAAAIAHQPTDSEITATQAENLEFDDLIDERKPGEDLEAALAAPDDLETAVAEHRPMGNEIPAKPDDDLELDDPIHEPKKGDDLDAAAQRIDEWFRSAKTVPDASLIGEVAESPDVEEIRDDLAPAGPSRANATIDLDANDADDFAAMADFDLDEPADRSPTTTISEDKPAWDDTEQIDGLLTDAPKSEELASQFAQDAESVDVEPPMSGEERPSINLFADNGASVVQSSKRRAPRRERSFARSLILIAAAGLFGSAAGYYALLWLRGPSIDFLNVAHFLPSVMLPGSFEEPKQIARNLPPANSADEMASIEPTMKDESTEPQELPPATEENAEPMSEAATAPDAASADAADQSAEVQAGYSEGEPADRAAAPGPAVGDRYTTASEPETGADGDSSATGVTSEKPATADLTVDELASTESPATEPNLPATTETGSEPTTLDATSADSLFGNTDTNDVSDFVDVKIAGAPSFAANDLRAALDAAAKAQPQLVAGNLADSKAVAQTKGRSYAMLADLAQKALFVDASQPSTQTLVKQADELFRATLADALARGEVAQILPRWISSPSRKHGGVFFAGQVVSHAKAGSVIECKVELDGNRTLTVLAPANAADQLDPAKPMAIVGWIVDAPQTQVSGYTGDANSPAIWANKLIPLE